MTVQNLDDCKRCCPAIPIRPRWHVVIRNSKPTSNYVFCALADGNNRVLPRILNQCVATGSAVADVNYRKGGFRH